MSLLRLHRASLEDSLKTTVIVKDINDIRDIIKKAYENWFINENFIIDISEYGFYPNNFDVRIGWYTQIVTSDIHGIVGFLSEPL